jgi:hypothetical protein
VVNKSSNPKKKLKAPPKLLKAKHAHHSYCT